MRIGVVTDAHANYPATLAAFAAMENVGCEHIIHTGDAIGIGPHPREVLEFLLSRNDSTLLLGNHDELFAHHLLDSPPVWMSTGELAHHRWTHAQLDDSWSADVSSWPLILDQVIGNTSIRFQHYALNAGSFGPVSKENRPEELNAAFHPETDIVFFGHHHPRADVIGTARYINPGALGCHPSLGARYAIIDVSDASEVSVQLHSVAYDATDVLQDMLQRKVPEGNVILQTFLS